MIYQAAEITLMVGAVLGLGAVRGPQAQRLLLVVQSYLIWAAFGVYVIAHIVRDLDLLHVSGVGAAEQNLFFRISGIWSDHGGSWFLWVALIGLLGPFIVLRARESVTLSRPLLLIQAANLIYLLALVNPFTLNTQPDVQGVLNPLLHDISLGIHPPILYTGTLLLFISALGLIHDPKEEAYLRAAKLGWAVHTVGITLGSIWAYYELGWGGWWFWDPVENMSLLPWLLGIFLLHPHKKVFSWVQTVSILIVISVLANLWLVRSGLVQSVHSFAHDAEQARALGMTVGAQILVALWGVRFSEDYVSRVAWQKWQIRIICLLLGVLGVTIYGPIVVATLYVELIAFTPAYFEYIVAPLMLLTVAGIIYFLAEGQQAFVQIALVGLILVLIGFAYYPREVVALAAIGVGLGILIQTLRGWHVFDRGLTFAHSGLGIMTLAIGLNAVFSVELTKEISKNPQQVGRAQIQLIRMGEAHTARHHKRHAVFRVTKNLLSRTLTPYFQLDKRTDINVSKTALHPYDFGLIMVSFSAAELHEKPSENDTITAYIRIDPYVLLIWFGALMMGVGAVLSTWFRRSENFV